MYVEAVEERALAVRRGGGKDDCVSLRARRDGAGSDRGCVLRCGDEMRILRVVNDRSREEGRCESRDC